MTAKDEIAPSKPASSGLEFVVLGLFFVSLGVFFSYAFYVRYWKWRECIAEVITSCALPGADNATTGGAMWAFPALLFLLLGAGLLLVAVIRLRPRGGAAQQGIQADAVSPRRLT